MKEIRNKNIPVRVTPTELNLIKEKADKMGVPISTFLRVKALAD